MEFNNIQPEWDVLNMKHKHNVSASLEEWLKAGYNILWFTAETVEHLTITMYKLITPLFGIFSP